MTRQYSALYVRPAPANRSPITPRDENACGQRVPAAQDVVVR